MNQQIFKSLKESVQKLSEENRLCTLVFDEIVIKPSRTLLQKREVSMVLKIMGIRKPVK